MRTITETNHTRRASRSRQPNAVAPIAAIAAIAFFLGALFLMVVDAIPAVAQPDVVGRWSEPILWPVTGIHAALLPTGEVLHYTYATGLMADGHDHVLQKSATDTPPSLAASPSILWDPRTGDFESIFIDQEIFCSGMSMLPDGSVFAAGGFAPNELCGIEGTYSANRFEPFASTWSALGDMSVARFYPSNVSLGNGEALIVSGLDDACSVTPVMEKLTNDGAIVVVPGGEREVALYPNLHLLSMGKVAHVGPEPDSYTFDPSPELWEFVATNNFGYRYGNSSVLLPSRTDQVLVIGGQDGASISTPTCEVIDFADPSGVPFWRYAPSMSFARAHANSVILPDGNVLVVGGGGSGLYDLPVLESELFDPRTDSWRVMAAQTFPRMYHSTAILLPDGRVLSSGQDNGASAFTSEIYEPPYLFRGPRPVIEGAPENAFYGLSFRINVSPDAFSIDAVLLISLSAQTHSINTPQRMVELDFDVAAANELNVAMPLTPNEIPPGYYMLFVRRLGRVPSIARLIHVGPAGATGVGAPTSRPAELLAFPNPISDAGTIRFSLAAPAHVRLAVFDVSGRLVREIENGSRVAGRHEVRWDGTDEHGRRVASGSYSLLLTTEGSVRKEQVIVVR